MPGQLQTPGPQNAQIGAWQQMVQKASDYHRNRRRHSYKYQGRPAGAIEDGEPHRARRRGEGQSGRAVKGPALDGFELSAGLRMLLLAAFGQRHDPADGPEVVSHRVDARDARDRGLLRGYPPA